MTFSFRIRFLRSPRDTIQLDTNHLLLPVEGLPLPLRLHNPEKNGTFLNATQLALVGDGFESTETAEKAGARFQVGLMIALARHRVGADFGARTPKGFVTEYGLAMFQQQSGQRLLNSTHGLMVYETNPKPGFISMSNVDLLRGVNEEHFVAAFLSAVAAAETLSDRELMAFNLFNASFFRQSPDSRFLLLMMAIESLLELRPRSEEAQAHVKLLVKQTQAANLPESERASMIGALRWLKNESITSAGRRMSSDLLGQRTYNDVVAERFFACCYELRSKLVHGAVPYPLLEDVNSIVGQLEVFVADLLTVPYLGMPAL